MKIFSFLYFSIFKIVEKEFPNKDTHRTTVGDISMPIGAFWAMLSLIVLAEANIWWIIVDIWDPDLAKPSKYNPLSPISILSVFVWYLSTKVLNWYFKKPEVFENLVDYYTVNHEEIRTYDTQGRLLLIFFYLAGFFNLVLFFSFGVVGLIPLVTFWGVVELWIRYEFEWKNNKKGSIIK